MQIILLAVFIILLFVLIIHIQLESNKIEGEISELTQAVEENYRQKEDLEL